MSDGSDHAGADAAEPEDDRRGSAATATPSKPKPGSAARPASRKLPPWKLVLHNDDVNAMEDVIDAIVTITPLPLEVALRKMLEAHTRGRSLLLTTHRELAELYQAGFTSRKLVTTLEPGDA